VVSTGWWYFAVNTTIEINKSNVSNWFYLIVATCFGPHLGPSSGSLIKYVSCYWTVLIWIHISATYQSYNTCNLHVVARIPFQNLKLYKIILPLNIKFYVCCFCVHVPQCRFAWCSLLYYMLQKLFTTMLLVFSLFSLVFLGWLVTVDFVFFFISLWRTVYSFSVGIYVVSVPGYNVDVIGANGSSKSMQIFWVSYLRTCVKCKKKRYGGRANIFSSFRFNRDRPYAWLYGKSITTNTRTVWNFDVISTQLNLYRSCIEVSRSSQKQNDSNNSNSYVCRARNLMQSPWSVLCCSL
jgi:hypothetical protein